MIERILKGWNLASVLYLILGSYVIIQSAIERQWLGVIIGGYFAAMGLFKFGCASGNCAANIPGKQATQVQPGNDLLGVDYEEVK